MRNIIKLERIIKGLANRRRLAILRYTASEKEAIVNDIAGEIRLSIKATSKHLNILIHCDILEREQRSRFMFYRLNRELHPLVKCILSIV